MSVIETTIHNIKKIEFKTFKKIYHIYIKLLIKMPKDKKEHKSKKEMKEDVEERKEVAKVSDDESQHDEEKQEKPEVGPQRRTSCLDYDMDEFKKQHEDQTIKDMTPEDILRYLRVIGKEQKNRDIVDGAEITLKKMNGEYRFRRVNRPPPPPHTQGPRPPQVMPQQYMPPAQRQFGPQQFGNLQFAGQPFGNPQYGRTGGQYAQQMDGRRQFAQRPGQYGKTKPTEGPSNGFEGSELV